MRLSDVIRKLQEIEYEIGDVDIFTEKSDGHSTWAELADPSVEWRRQWQGHPYRYYLEL